MTAPGIRGAIADELDWIAADVERRSDNVPMSRDGRGIEKVGTLREIAERIRARAADLRNEPATPTRLRGHCRTCDRTVCSLSADDPCPGCCECSGGGICLDLIEAAVTAVEKTMAALAALSPEERHENAQYGQSDAERIALAALRAADEVVR